MSMGEAQFQIGTNPDRAWQGLMNRHQLRATPWIKSGWQGRWQRSVYGVDWKEARREPTGRAPR